MEVRTCRGCGKLFNYLGTHTPVCPACMKLIEEKFERVKQYIRDNPGANIQMVADANEVSVKMIKQWVREERLTFTEGSSVGIECEGCGCNILTGRYCQNCKSSLQQNLNKITQAAKPKPEEPKKPASTQDRGKMRFLN